MSCLCGISFKAHQRKLYIATTILLTIIVNLSAVGGDSDLNNTNIGEDKSSINECQDEDRCSEVMHDMMQRVPNSDSNIRDKKSYMSSQYTERLKHSSIIYGLIVNANEDQLNLQCFNEIMQIYHGINRKEIWAMKILDSSGQSGSGFLLGNNHWLGSTKGCESVKEPLYITLSDRFERLMKPDLIYDTAPFEVDYRVVYTKHHSPWQVEIKFMSENLLHIGLCLPKSCTNSEIHNLTQDYFNTKVLDFQSVYEFEGDVVLVKDLQLRENFFYKPSVILACVIFAIVLLIVLFAWIRDERISDALDPTEAAQCVTMWDKILSSFSLQSNWKSLMDDSTPKGSINVINGIKSISCFFISAFHILWFSFYATSNPGVLFHLSEKARFQLIANAALMVDGFFTISGFLVSYNFLRSEKRMAEIKENSFFQNVKLFGKILMHRYIRLSPVYFMVGLFTEMFTSYIVDTSKFWVFDRTDLNCQRYWWRNLFYINNLFDQDELCMNWTWSMACEMQFFVAFMIILFIYAKKNSLGIKAYCAFTLAMFLIGSKLTVQYEFLPTFDVLLHTGTTLYISPLTRIMPYCVGVAFGWYLNNNRKTFSLTDRQRNFSFFLAILIITTCLHSTIYRDMSLFVASTVILAGRPILASSICWLIVTNACGYNCLVTKFFSSRIFARVNKLTYTIYLLNPIIITVLFGVFDNGGTVDTTLYAILIVGVFFISYWAAVVFSLLFEIPFYKLSNEMLKGSTPVPKKVN